MYEYCTLILYSPSNNAKLVLPKDIHNWLILSNKTVSNSNPSIYYVSTNLNRIYIIKSIFDGDINYLIDNQYENKLTITVSGDGNWQIIILHKGIKHKDPHPYIE